MSQRRRESAVGARDSRAARRSHARRHEPVMPVTIDQIRQAAENISGSVIATPCLHSRTLSQVTGAQVFLKFENLQFTASFKERGALNKLSRLGDRLLRARLLT